MLMPSQLRTHRPGSVVGTRRNPQKARCRVEPVGSTRMRLSEHLEIDKRDPWHRQGQKGVWQNLTPSHNENSLSANKEERGAFSMWHRTSTEKQRINVFSKKKKKKCFPPGIRQMPRMSNLGVCSTVCCKSSLLKRVAKEETQHPCVQAARLSVQNLSKAREQRRGSGTSRQE